MAKVDLIMPKMGESVQEATIIKWLKNEGDKIAMDEPVLEIATDKVDSEIPSTAEGVLAKKLFKEGEVVQVGKPIAVIATSAEIESTSSPVQAHVVTETLSSPVKNGESNAKIPAMAEVVLEKTSASGKFLSPLVRNIAKQEGISMTELEKISGTGQGGRITKQDILSYIPNRKKDIVIEKKIIPVEQEVKAPPVFVSGNDEIVEMDRMRKLIAEHMVMSKRVSAHVTSYVEADVTNIVKWRDRVKDDFEKREKEKITFTPVFIEAVTNAIKDFPMVNVSLDGTKII
ncbi:MAG TPA: 2-oxo acid dehydrogenase subunit E2, partial [Bacteroidia bacterium]